MTKKLMLAVALLVVVAAPIYAQSAMSGQSTQTPKMGFMAKLKAMHHKASATTTAPKKPSLMDKIKMMRKPAAASPMAAGSSSSSGSAMAGSTMSKMSSMGGTMASGGGAGKVWVNLSDGVYHLPGDRYYGKTKSGKYMSESAAVKAGYRPAKK